MCGIGDLNRAEAGNSPMKELAVLADAEPERPAVPGKRSPCESARGERGRTYEVVQVMGTTRT